MSSECQAQSKGQWWEPVLEELASSTGVELEFIPGEVTLEEVNGRRVRDTTRIPVASNGTVAGTLVARVLPRHVLRQKWGNAQPAGKVAITREQLPTFAQCVALNLAREFRQHDLRVAQALYAAQREQAVARIASAVSAKTTVADVLCTVLDVLADLIAFDYAEISLVDRNRRCIEILAHRIGESPARPRHAEALGPLRLEFGQGITGQVAANATAWNVQDVSAAPQYNPYFPGTRSELAVPLVLEGTVLGVLNLESTTRGFFSIEHEKMLDMVGPTIAAAVARCSQHDLMKRREEEWWRRFNAFSQLSGAVNRSNDEPVLLQRFADHTRSLFEQCVLATIWLYDPDLNDMLLVGTSCSETLPEGEPKTRKRLPLAGTLVGQVVRTGQPLVINTLDRTDSRIRRRDLVEKLELTGLLSIPLPSRNNGEPIGCINLFSRGSEFVGDDVRLLQLVAQFIASELSSLQTTLVLAAHRTTGDKCRHQPSSRKTLDAIATHARQMTQGRAASIFLFNESGLLELRGTTGIENNPEYSTVTYKPGEGLTGWVGQNGTPVRYLHRDQLQELKLKGITHVCRHPEDIGEPMIDPRDRELLVVPILSKGKCLGVIRVTGKHDPYPLTHLDQEIIEAIAFQVGTALEAESEARDREKRIENYKDRMSELFKLVAKLDASTDDERFLRGLVASAKKALNSDTASIALYDVDTNKLHFKLFEPREFEVIAFNNPRSVPRSLIGSVYHTQSPRNCPDMDADPLAKKIAPDSRASVIVPLSSADNSSEDKKKKLGILAVDSYQAGYFSDEDVQCLQTFAQVAADFMVLRSLLKERNDLIITLAHQLVAPLNAMTDLCDELMGERAAMDRISERGAKVLRCISSFGHLASSIASNFSAVRKVLDDPEFKLDLSTVPLTQMLIRVAALFQPIAWHRNMNISVDERIDRVGEIECDYRLLPQVFINIVDNAVKYSINGNEIRIWLSKRDSEYAVIAISNVGIHIPVTERTHIWKSGFRGALAEARQPNGTGIGLPIAKKIVEQHDGEVWVESQQKSDGSRIAETTFYVRIPLSHSAR